MESDQISLDSIKYNNFLKNIHKYPKYYKVYFYREAEWLFSTKAGRRNLVKVTKHNRLAIITLHRGQHYESFEHVQKELTDTICSLAPSSLTSRKVNENDFAIFVF